MCFFAPLGCLELSPHFAFHVDATVILFMNLCIYMLLSKSVNKTTGAPTIRVLYVVRSV